MWHVSGALVDNPFVHNGVVGCAVNGTGLKAHLFQQHHIDFPIAGMGRNQHEGLAAFFQRVQMFTTMHMQTLFGLCCNVLHMRHFCQNMPDIVPHIT